MFNQNITTGIAVAEARGVILCTAIKTIPNVFEFTPMQIKLAKDRNEKIAFILPVGPMGMYKWVVYFLKEWNVSCKHVYTLRICFFKRLLKFFF